MQIASGKGVKAEHVDVMKKKEGHRGGNLSKDRWSGAAFCRASSLSELEKLGLARSRSMVQESMSPNSCTFPVVQRFTP